MRSTRLVAYVLAAVSLVAGAAALFFGYYGFRLVYYAVTYRGEGSLGHVGMYIAAGLFPVLAYTAGTVSWISFRAARRRLKPDG